MPMSDTVKAAIINGAATLGGAVVGALAVWLVAVQGKEPAPLLPVRLAFAASPRFASPSALQGHVEHLRAGTSVWTFNEPFGVDGTVPGGVVYAEPGPCPVDSDGNWSCNATYIGAPADIGHRFRLYAAVLTDEQAMGVVRNSLVNTYHGGPQLQANGRPPHVDGVPVQSQDVTLVAPS